MFLRLSAVWQCTELYFFHLHLQLRRSHMEPQLRSPTTAVWLPSGTVLTVDSTHCTARLCLVAIDASYVSSRLTMCP
jgi:hypothetical protein